MITAFAVKRLTAHQVDPRVSNGHEIQGSSELLKMFGEADRRGMPCTYYWLPDGDVDSLRVDSQISWYDSRRNQPKRNAEYRLYYSAEAETVIQKSASVGDLAVIAMGKDGRVHLIVAASGSVWESRLQILFGLPSGAGNLFEVVSVPSAAEVGLSEDMLLEALGFVLPTVEDDEASRLIDGLFMRENGVLPKTEVFSRFARKHFVGPDVREDPDAAVVAWMEWETQLFRLFEAKLITKRLRDGFVDPDGGYDVDGFLKFARSVGNTRFSRAGWAFEHHVGAALDAHNVRYSARCITEHGKAPDLLFPGISFYHNENFPADHLRMLGLKTSLKDRWRQVANEANRIPVKHLLTLEAPVSSNQMDEMKEASVSLVIPAGSHPLFGARQSELMTFKNFIGMVLTLQKSVENQGFLTMPTPSPSTVKGGRT